VFLQQVTPHRFNIQSFYEASLLQLAYVHHWEVKQQSMAKPSWKKGHAAAQEGSLPVSSPAGGDRGSEVMAACFS